MSETIAEKEAAEWLIIKRGLYFMPNAQGYTGVRDNAGRYTLTAANRYADDEHAIVHEASAPEFSKSCYDDVKVSHLQGKIQTLLRALDEAQERAERAEAALKAAQEPDMFWDQENPETPYWDIEELLREREYDRDTDVVIETSEAIRCDDNAYLCRIISAAEDADDDSPTFSIRKLTEDERKEYRNIERIWYAIRQLKPLFAARAAQTLKERNDG